MKLQELVANHEFTPEVPDGSMLMDALVVCRYMLPTNDDEGRPDQEVQVLYTKHTDALTRAGLIIAASDWRDNIFMESDD